MKVIIITKQVIHSALCLPGFVIHVAPAQFTDGCWPLWPMKYHYNFSITQGPPQTNEDGESFHPTLIPSQLGSAPYFCTGFSVQDNYQVGFLVQWNLKHTQFPQGHQLALLGFKLTLYWNNEVQLLSMWYTAKTSSSWMISFFLYFFIYLFICLFVCLFICLFVCLFLFVYFFKFFC